MDCATAASRDRRVAQPFVTQSIDCTTPISQSGTQSQLLLHQHCRVAASASVANWPMNWKNSFDWPTNRPIAVRNVKAPIAAPFVSVGRMTEHMGRSRLRKGHGSGMIKLGW